ncbi:hypothetical protein [Nocardia terpenica]|uniref:Uncharacterized protein n=1 Tax=Nocardia terpenica TaxID=455432 RepID=A0A164IUG9_9NOCA|nr:hypothetical protein [Nocardia terpenica]KZM69757.1 hypothetical protein AWN90_06955 [Nocardia terpenica]NQE89466.1 hypothetical protein [Nocardia terpenica]
MIGQPDEPQATSPGDPEPIDECRPDSIIDLARALQRQLAVPVWVECGRPVTVAGPALGAVSMPQALGARVIQSADPQVVLPVLADPLGHRRIFLVDPTEPIPPRMNRLLAADHVVVVPHGHRIPLPGANAAGSWRWVRHLGHHPIQPPTRTWLLHQIRPHLTSDHRRGARPGPIHLRETP